MHIDKEIEKLFCIDVRDKKRVGRGAYNKKASGLKGSKVGKLNTPSAYLTPAKIKKLSGECKTMNMNKLMNYEEFIQNSEDVQKTILEFWRSDKTNFNQKDIMKGLGLKSNQYYSLLNSLDIKRQDLSCKKYRDKIVISKEEMDEILDSGPIDYDRFISLNRECQAYLTIKWSDKYGLRCGDKILLNVNPDRACQYIHNIRYRMKKILGVDWINIILQKFEHNDIIEEVAITTEDSIYDIEIIPPKEKSIYESKDIFIEPEVEKRPEVDIKFDTDVVAATSCDSVNVLDIKGIFTKNILNMILDQLDSNKQYKLELVVQEVE